MRRAAILFILLVAIGSIVYQAPYIKVVGEGWIYAPAVSQVGGRYVGALVNISLTVTEGSGNVYVSTSPLTEIDMQATAQIAARTACNLLGLNFSKYNFLYMVRADSIIVGGPSAGAVMTILTYSVLSGKPINRSVMMTGTINPDGSVGQVGGVKEKMEAAISGGAKLFLVPPGQSVVTTYSYSYKKIGPFTVRYITSQKVNLTKLAREKYGVAVREIGDIREALSYFLGVKISEKESVKPPYPSTIETVINKVNSRIKSETLRILGEASTRKSQANPLLYYTIVQLVAKANSTIRLAEQVPTFRKMLLYRESLSLAKEAELLTYSETSDALEKKVKEIVSDFSNLANRTAPCWCDTCIIGLQYLIQAEIELADAEKIWKESLLDALSAASKAYADIFIAKQLTEQQAEKFRNRLIASKDLLTDTSAILAYSQALVQGPGKSYLTNARILYDLAKKYLLNGEECKAAIALVESQSYAELALSYEQALISQKATQNILERSRAKAALLAGETQNRSMLPAYYYYLADSSRSFQEKYLYYRLAAHFSQLLSGNHIVSYTQTHSNKSKEKPRNPITPPQPQTEAENEIDLKKLALLVILIALIVYLVLRKR